MDDEFADNCQQFWIVFQPDAPAFDSNKKGQEKANDKVEEPNEENTDENGK